MNVPRVRRSRCADICCTDPPGAFPNYFLVPVPRDSPAPIRRAVETVAFFFKREFGNDKVQYVAEDPDRSARAFLWTRTCPYDDHVDNDVDVVIGACCFRWRTKREAPKPGYALQWVWLHPYERGRGHLDRVWGRFESQFGRFYLEGPTSRSMAAFVTKRGDTHEII